MEVLASAGPSGLTWVSRRLEALSAATQEEGACMGTVRSKSGAQYGVPKTGKETWRRPPPGRVCAYEGCSTILSSYNASPRCFAHAERPKEFRDGQRRM